MKIQILEEAQQDLAFGFQFYESQSHGLGDYFLNSLFSDIDSLQIYAGIHAPNFGYQRLLAKRFPFAVYRLRSCRESNYSNLCGVGLQAESDMDSRPIGINLN
jgi:hypothetical protein